MNNPIVNPSVPTYWISFTNDSKTEVNFYDYVMPKEQLLCKWPINITTDWNEWRKELQSHGITPPDPPVQI